MAYRPSRRRHLWLLLTGLLGCSGPAVSNPPPAAPEAPRRPGEAAKARARFDAIRTTIRQAYAKRSSQDVRILLGHHLRLPKRCRGVLRTDLKLFELAPSNTSALRRRLQPALFFVTDHLRRERDPRFQGTPTYRDVRELSLCGISLTAARPGHAPKLVAIVQSLGYRAAPRSLQVLAFPPGRPALQYTYEWWKSGDENTGPPEHATAVEVFGFHGGHLDHWFSYARRWNLEVTNEVAEVTAQSQVRFLTLKPGSVHVAVVTRRYIETTRRFIQWQETDTVYRLDSAGRKATEVKGASLKKLLLHPQLAPFRAPRKGKRTRPSNP